MADLEALANSRTGKNMDDALYERLCFLQAKHEEVIKKVRRDLQPIIDKIIKQKAREHESANSL